MLAGKILAISVSLTKSQVVTIKGKDIRNGSSNSRGLSFVQLESALGN